MTTCYHQNQALPLKEEEFKDFFVTYDQSICHISEDLDCWKYTVNQMHQQIFNSTSIVFPSPEKYFLKKAKEERKLDKSFSAFNCGYNDFCFSDPLIYRRQRSENLVFRMIHCKIIDMKRVSIMRLSQGVFVHHKWQPEPSQSSLTVADMKNKAFNTHIFDIQAEAPMNTYQCDHVIDIPPNNNLNSCYEAFIPYSYTFGAKYTNPYGQQSEPILPYVSIKGLFPFAPHIAVAFKSFTEDEINPIVPEIGLVYEHFTYEYNHFELEECEHVDVHWPERKKEVLKNMLVCDLPDNLAEILTDMAVVWAASQGLLFQDCNNIM
ncbi:uncharacterized protein BX663DRAFT_539174 [Cokeromyces recurvatus]|uniref:uncharacterized protein n=1 Tax=Cokeromyces recurvatus TaxID=90255 RepID=UPI00221ECF3D|nr:uncharacterized protein BX663DRAFT_539174 [Cokeromyces recurvatus]KAI7907736.1 hypothetical protein BX663DRAFT_539174 [Cokeromyces recurvatus]